MSQLTNECGMIGSHVHDSNPPIREPQPRSPERVSSPEPFHGFRDFVLITTLSIYSENKVLKNASTRTSPLIFCPAFIQISTHLDRNKSLELLDFMKPRRPKPPVSFRSDPESTALTCMNSISVFSLFSSLSLRLYPWDVQAVEKKKKKRKSHFPVPCVAI